MKTKTSRKPLRLLGVQIPDTVLRFFPKASPMGMPDKVTWEHRIQEERAPVKKKPAVSR